MVDRDQPASCRELRHGGLLPFPAPPPIGLAPAPMVAVALRLPARPDCDDGAAPSAAVGLSGCHPRPRRRTWPGLRRREQGPLLEWSGAGRRAGGVNLGEPGWFADDRRLPAPAFQGYPDEPADAGQVEHVDRAVAVVAPSDGDSGDLVAANPGDVDRAAADERWCQSLRHARPTFRLLNDRSGHGATPCYGGPLRTHRGRYVRDGAHAGLVRPRLSAVAGRSRRGDQMTRPAVRRPRSAARPAKARAGAGHMGNLSTYVQAYIDAADRAAGPLVAAGASEAATATAVLVERERRRLWLRVRRPDLARATYSTMLATGAGADVLDRHRPAPARRGVWRLCAGDPLALAFGGAGRGR